MSKISTLMMDGHPYTLYWVVKRAIQLNNHVNDCELEKLRLLIVS